MTRRAAVIRKEREKAKHMLVLDAGDSLLNNRQPAKETRGKTSIEAMNKMGYDAMALGMLDLSLLGLDELKQRMAEARFPVLSANAYITGTKELVAKPYVVIPMDDHRVGILGLTEAGATPHILVTDPLQAAKDYLPELHRAADIIILLSHAGLDMDKKIASELAGIDVIVSGQAKTVDTALVIQSTGTLIIHADVSGGNEAGRTIGIAHLSFDKAGRRIKHDWNKIVLTSDLPEDPEIKAWLSTTY